MPKKQNNLRWFLHGVLLALQNAPVYAEHARDFFFFSLCRKTHIHTHTHTLGVFRIMREQLIRSGFRTGVILVLRRHDASFATFYYTA